MCLRPVLTSPNRPQQLAVGDEPTLTLSEDADELKLDRGEEHDCARAAHPPAREIDDQLADLKPRSVAALAWARQDTSQPGDQLRIAERLGQALIGTSVEGTHRLTLVTRRRHNHDRQPAEPPDLPTHLDTATIRQHEVEHQDGGRMRRQK